jgi:hypothetical protein
MDDDKVEYAEIESGHPTNALPITKRLPARNTERQTISKGVASYNI